MTQALSVTLRVATAGLLAAIAAIHLDLWDCHGYQHIPIIGPMFLLNGIAGSILALACLATPRRVVALGLFGFTETTTAPRFNQAIATEAATILTSALLAITSRHQPPASEQPRP